MIIQHLIKHNYLLDKDTISMKGVIASNINDCKGEEVFSLFIVHISLAVASKVTSEGGGDPLLMKV